jgi:CBS domain-containing protein
MRRVLTTIGSACRLQLFPAKNERRRTMNESVRDVMTPAPCALAPSDSVMTAAETMRANGIGDVILLEEKQLFGILTDRVLAEGADPNTTMASVAATSPR